MNKLFDNKSTESAIALVALHAGYSHSSLALQSIAAYLTDEPYADQVRIIESLVNRSPQALLESLVALKPGVIGFSTYLWNIQACLHLTGLLAQLLEQTLIVLGGPEAGPRGEELLLTHPEVDFVIDGEGEAAFRELLRWHLQGLGELSAISGLVYRQGTGIVRNPLRPLAVEAIPAPIAQGLADFSKPLIYWETSRGCPFRCSFCGSATERLRTFPLQRVEEDLAVLAGLQNKVIKLLDRSFHLGRERTLWLLERFAATPAGLRFHLELNPDRISAQAMAIFRQAPPGKFQFEIGLQTLNEPVLRAIERRMEIPRALDNIRELVAMARHPVHLDLIVGLPGEDAAQCRDSLNRVFNLQAEHLQLGTLKLLPGTPLRQQATQLGYRWDRQPPYEVLSHPWLAFRQLARFKLYAELLERLWNSGLLVATLSRLVAVCFEHRVADCFDALLGATGESIARDNLQPDRLFDLVSGYMQPRLCRDPVLRELLLWDYSHFSLVNSKTPAWIADQLKQSVALTVAGSRRRLPVLELSPEAITVINRRRLEPLATGYYAVWPRQHKKGTPVEIIPVARPAG